MRKSLSKSHNSYELLDLRVRTNKHKKSVHEELINPQSSRKESQRLTKKDVRLSRNSLPVKYSKRLANSEPYSPRMRSPYRAGLTRRTGYEQ